MPLTLVFTTLGAASTNHGLPHNFANLAAGDSAVVREIVDGGRQVYLVGIQAPKLPLGRANFEKWPLADEAKKAPTKLVLERRVTLGYGGQRQDRYGRELAHLFTDEGLWVLGILLELGFARGSTVLPITAAWLSACSKQIGWRAAQPWHLAPPLLCGSRYRGRSQIYRPVFASRGPGSADGD